MNNLEKALNDHIRGCAPYVHVADFEAGYRAAMRQEPTHYAVIDEHGEIVHTMKVTGLVDAEATLRWFIEYYQKSDDNTLDASRWTVKGVTVNE